MELRIDRLLDLLRADPAALLARIDADPLLVKRTSGDLVLANASKGLFTPTEPHHLFAKGIVFRRDPYRLVSLSLLKIYNLGERSVTAADLSAIVSELADGRVYFLRKLDGTLIQRFEDGGRVWFTTRGVIEGSRYVGTQDEDAPDRLSHFDFLGEARRIATSSYPRLLDVNGELAGLTLLFEFLHPETRVITDYGDRQDLVLTAAFDRERVRYLPHAELEALAAAHGLTCVDVLPVKGTTLAERIDDLLAALKGTDQEGVVLTVEHAAAVTYRAKVKSPDYLRILKMTVTCNYARTAELIDAHPEWQEWADLEAYLQALGSDQVPEEVLGFYREHYDTHLQYLADCRRLLAWGLAEAGVIRARLLPGDERAMRKAFAAEVVGRLLSPLLFAAFGGKLTLDTVRAVVKTPEEAAGSAPLSP
jgi:RNA ligase